MNNDDNIQQILAALLHELQQRNVEVPDDSEAEQPQLLFDEKPKRPADYRKLDRSAANAGKRWSKEETRIAWFAYNGGCTLKEIGKHLDRTQNALKKHIDKIKAGLVEL